MKYDARACQFNMDTGCVELLLRDGRMISIDCTGVEDALDVTMAQRSELDYLIYYDSLGYADLILNGEPEEYRNRQISRRIKKHLWLSNRSWARDVHSFGILHSWGALAGKSCSAQASSIWLIAGAFRRTQSK